MVRAVLIAGLVVLATAAGAQTPDGADDNGTPPAATPGEAPVDPPIEFPDPDEMLNEFEKLIEAKRMDDLFVALVRAANLTHPVKHIDPEALRRIGHNLLDLFADSEKIHYVDRVRDERFGTSLRQVVFLAYTSRDRWIYFTFVLKRGAVGWQVTKFDYAIDRFELFPPAPPPE